MTKPLLLFQGPIRSRSGYGDHTRDLILSLINMNKFDILVAPTKWGDCSETGLDSHPERDKLTKVIMKNNQLPKKPDVYINCSVPNEFQPIGNFNIGITAGIETTVADASWIEGCNRMDLIIVPSHHSRDVLNRSTYDKIDEKTRNKVGSLKIEKPIQVLFEGLDTSIYKQTSVIPKSITEELSSIKEEFCYLYVGHWLSGDLGHDRKDTGMLIKTFCNAFKNKEKKPALILKTSMATFSILDRDNITNKIKHIKSEFGNDCPSIYLIHGDLTPDEMNGLYNHKKVKAHVSFTKGEGFGRPLLEAAATGKPVIAPNWSGHIDFLHPDYSVLLPGKLQEVHKSARWKGVINKGTEWFYVNYKNAEIVLRDVYQNYAEYIEKAKKQAELATTKFTLQEMQKIFTTIIENDVKISPIPQQVGLNLPKLKKLKNNPGKLKLPKLKKG